MAGKQTPVMRFVPALWAALLHLVLFAGAFALFLGRKSGVFRSQAVRRFGFVPTPAPAR